LIIQEIKLERLRPEDKLGLTLCDAVNKTDEKEPEEDNEVYIQSIAPESLAAADGRLSQGDLLLQVNIIYLSFLEREPSVTQSSR